MLFALLTLSAAQGAAQPARDHPPAPVQGSDVVVKGQREAERRRRADAFVRRVAPVPTGGQLARWQRPICPGVIGLSDELNAHVAERVRAIARTVGAPLKEAGCSGNALVAFTPDAADLLKKIERIQPQMIAGVVPAERQALRKSKGAVLWWSSSLTEGADGDQTHDGILRQYRDSLISTMTQASYVGAVVLVDAERSTGVRLDAVADYAAFVILSGARFGGRQGETSSILDLFQAPPEQRPSGLTDADRAYLKGLYTMRPDRTARVQSRAITTRIVRDAGVVAE